MVMQKEIPKEDVKLLNDALQGSDGQAIIKNSSGQAMQKGRANLHPFNVVIQDFRGRILKHDMHVIPKGGTQILIGTKGQRFEDIPLDKRQLAFWSETDFE